MKMGDFKQPWVLNRDMVIQSVFPKESNSLLATSRFRFVEAFVGPFLPIPVGIGSSLILLWYLNSASLSMGNPVGAN